MCVIYPIGTTLSNVLNKSSNVCEYKRVLAHIHKQTDRENRQPSIIGADPEYYNTITSDCKQEVTEDTLARWTQSITFACVFVNQSCHSCVPQIKVIDACVALSPQGQHI